MGSLIKNTNRPREDFFIKKEAETSTDLGKSPGQRTVDELLDFGVISLNKPPGPTSHETSDYVQKILGIEKAGHGGSLDPRVTGVLPITLGNATRLSRLFLTGGKEYVGILHLHGDVEEKKLRETALTFIGKITQLPPVRSAVKRQLRKRDIYSFDILEIEGKDVLFRVSCEAGTYIRKLCHDLAKALGTRGHMADLRRIRASHFHEKDSVTLHDLKDAFVLWKEKGNEKFIRYCIKPGERIVDITPKVWVFDSAVESICHGRDVAVPGISKLSRFETGQPVAVLTLKDELVAFGKAQLTHEMVLKLNKGIAVKTEKVFMKPGTYQLIIPSP